MSDNEREQLIAQFANKAMQYPGVSDTPVTTDPAWIHGCMQEVWLAAYSAGRAPLLELAIELTKMTEAYRLHHKLMLQITNDTDCPCSICKQAIELLDRARKEVEP